MIADVVLLAIMSKRENLQRYRKYIKPHAVMKETLTLLADYEKYFDEFPMYPQIDFSAFQTWFITVRHPSMKPDDVMLYQKIFEKAEKEAGDPTHLTESVIEYFIELDYAHRLRHESEQAALGIEPDLTKVMEIVKEYQEHKVTVVGDEADPFVTTDLDELVADTVGGGGYDWRLEELNEILGPLRKSNFVVVAARPETGKTTFLASEITHMAQQLEEEQSVLWFCNEEAGKGIQFRVFQAALGENKATIMSDLPKAKAELTRILGRADKIKVYYQPYMTKSEVESLCDRFNPGIIIFDQLDKIQGFKGDREDNRLQAGYQWARGLANEYGPVLAVSQCDGTAQGVRYPTMEQLAGSRTAKQGEADAIIMIGQDYDPTLEYTRFINVPKNKLAGGTKSLESRRHGKAEVLIHPDIARYSA